MSRWRAYPLPPQIDPAFANNGNVDWFNGQAASRPALYDNWTASVQREVRKGLTVEVDFPFDEGLDVLRHWRNLLVEAAKLMRDREKAGAVAAAE